MARNSDVASDPHFDESIHAPTRLRLCAMLRPVDSAEFSALTSTLGVSEANLSKTIRNLVELGYITTSKHSSPDRSDFRRRTNVSLTSRGRQAFDQHLAALQEIANSARSAQTPIAPTSG